MAIDAVGAEIRAGILGMERARQRRGAGAAEDRTRIPNNRLLIEIERDRRTITAELEGKRAMMVARLSRARRWNSGAGYACDRVRKRTPAGAPSWLTKRKIQN